VAQFFVRNLFHLGSASLQGFGIDVLEHHFAAALGGYKCDARPHHARTDDAHPGKPIVVHLWQANLFVRGILEEPKRPDHVFGLIAAGQLDEIAAFHQEGGIEVEPKAFVHRTEDAARRHVGTGGLLFQKCRGTGDDVSTHFRIGSGTGDAKTVFIPRLFHTRIFRDEGQRLLVHDLFVFTHAIHQPFFEGFLGTQHLALKKALQRILDANHSRQTLGASGSGQEAQVHFGKAHLDAPVVQNQTVVAGEHPFEAATQGIAVDAGHHGNPALFDLAKEALKVFQALFQVFR
jgi:hypothetical protein